MGPRTGVHMKGRPNNDIIFYASKGDSCRVRRLLEQGEDVNKEASAALRCAAIRGDAFLTILLLNWGADVDPSCKLWGSTTLESANAGSDGGS